jgi:hypothetical protein
MDSSKLSLKLFVAEPWSLQAGELVPVFHGWIQRHAVADHLLVDVADYKHVHHGPGTMLIAHEGNFALDEDEGRPGLMYARKQPLPGSFADRLRAVLSTLLEAAERLEQEPALAGRMKFRTDEMVFRIHDRLLGPSNAETFNEVKGDLEGVLGDVYGGRVSLEFRPSDEKLFEVRIKAPAKDVSQLLTGLRAGAH